MAPLDAHLDAAVLAPRSAFAEFANQHLARLLTALQMDKQFVRGDGCVLYDRDGARTLDFLSGYGALPFGHSPREIWAAITDVRDSGEPMFVQPSDLVAAGELARTLAQKSPGELARVTFVNSGAEAVEAAIKLCRSATGRQGILSAQNSYHGKTLGALSATGRDHGHALFGAPAPGFFHVPFGDLEALERALGRAGPEIAAFFVEPIQGEGGIVPAPDGYLAEAASLCRRRGALLVVDEIQTGLGRTGRLFACEREGVSPDVLLLAKALGGGVLPIGAVLCTKAVDNEAFALSHSSTFAASTLACRVGLRTIELLCEGDQALIRQVADNGELLLERLRALAARYPRVVRAVRGRGYMLGIELGVDRDSYPHASYLVSLADHERLSPVLASYLLNRERLRVAPTLNGGQVLRIQPPLIATRQMCEEAAQAIERMVERLDAADTAGLLGHLLGRAELAPAPRHAPSARPSAPRAAPRAMPGDGRFAFIVHPIDLQSYLGGDPMIAGLSPLELARLSGFAAEFIDLILGAPMTVEAGGARARGELIALTLTPEQMLADRARATALVRRAVRLARDRGARVVGLGAFTSVVTRGGQLVCGDGVAISSGNSYTVVAAVEAILRSAAEVGLAIERATVAVLGATGAIGRAVSILLAERAGRMVLVGNPKAQIRARSRLHDVVAALCEHVVLRGPSGAGELARRACSWAEPAGALESWAALARGLERSGHLTLTADVDAALAGAELVVTATSSTQPLVTAGNVKSGAVVCDLSRPSNVSRSLPDERPDVLVIDGGIVAPPDLPDIGMDVGLAPGHVYACLAETMLLALEQRYLDTSIGTDLQLDTILDLREIGKRRGFELAALRSFGHPLSPHAFRRVKLARREG